MSKWKSVLSVMGIVSLALMTSSHFTTVQAADLDATASPNFGTTISPTTSVEAKKGKVTKVDKEKKELTVKVKDKEHTVAASKVKLLKADGKAAKLSDFSAKQSVEVTFKDGAITSIQISK